MRFWAKKIPAMLAMLLSLPGIALLIAAAIGPEIGIPIHLYDEWAYWLYAVIFFLGSLPFYLVDAVLLIIRAHFGVNSTFNIILAALIICAIPILFCLIGRIYILVAVTFIIIFILQIISIIQHVK